MPTVEQVSPSANNYMRGGARVKVRRLTEPPGQFLDLGNVVSVTITPQKTETVHFTGRSGSRVRDAQHVFIDSIQYEIVTDEYTTDNVREWLQGGPISAVTQPAATDLTVTIESLTGASDETEVRVGRYYNLGKLAVSNVHPTGGASNLVEGVDFKVDYEAGQIAFLRALNGSEFGGSFTFDCAALTGKRFAPLSEAIVEVEAIGLDALQEGRILDVYTIPKGVLAPSGGGVVTIEEIVKLNLTLTQLYHPIEKWGTRTRYERS